MFIYTSWQKKGCQIDWTKQIGTSLGVDWRSRFSNTRCPKMRPTMYLNIPNNQVFPSGIFLLPDAIFQDDNVGFHLAQNVRDIIFTHALAPTEFAF